MANFLRGHTVRWILVGGVIALCVIQLVPIDRVNPPLQVEMPAPDSIRTVLRRACYDCHSNETVWPWYSRVAPVSWLVGHDVHDGRRELNFTDWNAFTPQRQGRKYRAIVKEVGEGDMPPWYYVMMHRPQAVLSDSDRAVLKNWAGALAPPSTDRGEK